MIEQQKYGRGSRREQFEALITVEEEQDLLRRVAQGDAQALEEFVKAYLAFFHMVARHYCRQESSMVWREDLVQVGVLALLRGIEYFDETRGNRFITYIGSYIRRDVAHYVHEHSSAIRLTDATQDQVYTLNKKAEVTEQEEPLTTHEILAAVQRAKRLVQSLDAPVESFEGEHSFGELLADETQPSPEEQAEQALFSEQVQRACHDILSDQECNVLMYRYGLFGQEKCCSWLETAKQMQTSREQVRQIEGKALRKLEQSSHVQQLYASL